MYQSRKNPQHTPLVLLLLCLVFLLASCSSLITTTIVEPTVGNLQKQTDLELVCEGAPAYLLMIDSMIASDPKDGDLLRIGAQSYSGYAAAMAECGYSSKRIAAITDKSHLYAISLLGQLLPLSTGVEPETFSNAIQTLTENDLENLFWGTLAWITWVREQHGSPASLADLVKIEQIMTKVLELNEAYEQGSAHLFFGAYHAAKPEMLGGNFQLSKHHFERALEISEHSFLLIQTTYAETYARLTMDRKLHDTLLREVLAFPLEKAPENALSNQIAKRKAAKLLADDYFLE